MAINIPYGYIIKSRKGNAYIKTPNGWITNGKPANPGIIKNLEAAAERNIEKYNDSPDNLVKIGQEYKSNNGKIYFYNGTNFMSADGKKKLAGGAQESAMRKLQQQASSETTDVGDGESTGSDVVEPETNNVEPSTDEQPESSTDSVSSTGSKSLQELADIISNHPQKRKLITLMSRGDKVSLIAADIILAGKTADAIKQLSGNQ